MDSPPKGIESFFPDLLKALGKSTAFVDTGEIYELERQLPTLPTQP